MIAVESLDHVLLDLALLFALCIAVVVGFHRIKVPPIAGFLIAGALLGPHAFGLVKQPTLVEHLAEIGVVVLLFTVGMELSLRDLVRMRRSLLLGGGLQIGSTIALGASVSLVTGQPWGTSIFMGFLLTLSSTAAISKLLQDRGELGSPPGRLAMAICVAQDLAVVPMILVLPLLAGGMGSAGGSGGLGALLQVGQSFLALALTMGAAWLVVPRVLDLVARTRSREVFVLTIFTLCLAAATVTAMLGLSLALGAFLVGLVLSESGYHHQATAEVEPFRDALSSLFFVSIGMLFDYRVILEHPIMVVLALLAVVLGKTAIVMIAARALALPWWVGVRTGLLLAQVGEFSFVVVQVARSKELELGSLEKVFIVVAVLSIALTPLLMFLGRRFARGSAGGGDRADQGSRTRREHVVIVGFGPVGQAVGEALHARSIPFMVIEMNAQTVKKYKQRGYPIFLGDSSRVAVLHAAGIEHARILVLAVNDPDATKRTADQARRLNPHLRIIARANFIGEVPALRELGVQEVVPQELETAVEIMVRVLHHYLVPDAEVAGQVRHVRRAAGVDTRPQRPPDGEVHSLVELVPGLSIEILRVAPGSALDGRALKDTDLRRLSGCTVVAVKRGAQTDVSIRPETVLEAEDIAVLLGPSGRLVAAECLFAADPDGGRRVLASHAAAAAD